ncbi:MAG TPA: hypothetical protein VES20_09555 [Bryobacteraceae bacterium]|nr:hypothetical protein [Bryobacteraceae bacterium]
MNDGDCWGSTNRMVKLGSIRWKGRCSRHPGYAPEIDGLGGIRGGCKRCEMLLEIWHTHHRLIRLMREFGSRTDDSTPKPADSAPADDRQMSLLDG